jgi:putative salt-induced outer membrane protein YdiY
MKPSLLLLLTLIIVNDSFSAEWNNESELSVIQTGGNTKLETYNFSTLTKYQHLKSIYTLGGHYTLGTAVVTDSDDSTQTVKKESARNWDAHTKYEQVLSEILNGFVAIKIEGDEFSGYKQRDNYDLGAKYKLHDDSKMKSHIELGLRYTIEKTVERNSDDEDIFNDNKMRSLYEIDQELNPGLSYKFWIEYVYNFSRPEDYLINLEPSLSFSLNNIFSLKLSYKGSYDNEPASTGNEYLDWKYTTGLLAKF